MSKKTPRPDPGEPLPSRGPVHAAVEAIRAAVDEAVRKLTDADYLEVLDTVAGDCAMMADAKREELGPEEDA